MFKIEELLPNFVSLLMTGCRHNIKLKAVMESSYIHSYIDLILVMGLCNLSPCIKHCRSGRVLLFCAILASQLTTASIDVLCIDCTF